jgi:hypothetical protein
MNENLRTIDFLRNYFIFSGYTDGCCPCVTRYSQYMCRRINDVDTLSFLSSAYSHLQEGNVQFSSLSSIVMDYLRVFLVNITVNRVSSLYLSKEEEEKEEEKNRTVIDKD